MRATLSGLVFLVFASLSQAQFASPPQGQGKEIPSCRQFFLARDEKYYLDNVRAFFDIAKGGGSLSSTDQGVQALGDGVSVDVLKIFAANDLVKPEFVKAYLEMAKTAFSRPELTACAEDKSPEVTLFLLNYLREKVNDKDLQRQIDSVKQYILNQTRH
jgi:hypothetical protein